MSPFFPFRAGNCKLAVEKFTATPRGPSPLGLVAVRGRW
jgi:hypothetical protein